MKSQSTILQIVMLGFIILVIIVTVVLNKEVAELYLSSYSQNIQQDTTTGSDSEVVSSNIRQLTIKGNNNIECNDIVWCSIAMPTKSYFRFDNPPDDVNRWKLACSQAASGEQVLMKKIRKVFTTHLDFLDGDTFFRRYNKLSDVFVDKYRDMSPLVPPGTSLSKSRRKRKYPWESDPKIGDVIPYNYDFRQANRSPIVQFGYFAHSRVNHSQWFDGPLIGEAFVGVPHIYKIWSEVKNHLDVPWILSFNINENWGLLSTEFPNRTIDWIDCCDKRVDIILNHDKTLLFLVNQHHNMTHPKILTLPRGLPIYTERRAIILWDILRTWSESVQKDTLVFTSGSSWRHRPYITECIAKKFKPEDLQINMVPDMQSKTFIKGNDYYMKLVKARTGIALSGLGYDTFRLWEYLTLGTVPVLEKGIGLDKTLWRLPAVLVEDFDDVTPDLLRVAYVEALYRVNEFEFERLKQSFWFEIIMNVSASKSLDPIIDRFPPQSEDPTFTRPKVPYPCGITNTCGVGTKRIPKSSCGGLSKPRV